MNLIDYVVIVIVALSVLLGVKRGLLREILAFASWVVAISSAYFFAAKLDYLMPLDISNESLRWLVNFAFIFFIAMVLMSLVAMLLSKLLSSAGLSVEDRLLGAIFGLLRGGVILSILVLMVGATALPKHVLWQSSLFHSVLEQGALLVRDCLPPELARHINYG